MNTNMNPNTVANNEAIHQLMFLLEISKSNEHTYVKELVDQMNAMESQIREMNLQLEEMKKQMLNRPHLKDRIKEIPEKVSQKITDVQQSVNELKEHIAGKGREWVENIKQTGELKLYTILDKAKVMDMLGNIRQKLANCIKALENGIKRIDSIENELKQSGQHIKNAVRLASGKEAQEKEPAKANNPLSKVLRFALKTCQKMLDGVNKAILSYDRLENSVAGKNPSVLKKIGQYKEESDKQKETDAKNPAKASKEAYKENMER